MAQTIHISNLAQQPLIDPRSGEPNIMALIEQRTNKNKTCQ